jgi:hypothetical protein
MNIRPWDPWDMPDGRMKPLARGQRPPTFRRLCSECLLSLVEGDVLDEARFRYQFLSNVRKRVGDPPGTLFAFAGQFRSDLPTYLVGIGVDAWDLSRPQLQILRGRGFPQWHPPVIVTLAAIISPGLAGVGLAHFAAASKAPAWQFSWSWEQPDEPATCLLHNWDTPLTKEREKQLMHARNAFIKFTVRRGRRSGAGSRFETREDFGQALRVAVGALKKRGQPVTTTSVGRYFAAQGTRNRTVREINGEAPADPGRQVRAWCKRFAVDFEEAISGL